VRAPVGSAAETREPEVMRRRLFDPARPEVMASMAALLVGDY
jgi:hypothetical protein